MLKVSNSMDNSYSCTRQNRNLDEWGAHNSITINVPSKKEISKNKYLFASVLRKLREGKQKDDMSLQSGDTEAGEEVQRMSYEEIAVYVDTKAR